MANKLEYYRLKHNLSVTELCQKVHGTKHHNTIVFHESKLSAKAALKYAAALGESPFDLLDEDVLVLKPTNKADKDKVLKIIQNLKVDDE